MKFSLTYPEYCLLDIKALSEYHAACVATDLDFVSDQSLLSLNDTKLRAREQEIFMQFCSYFYQISRLVDLELYWEIFHTIAHLGEGEHSIQTSNLIMNYTIDIDDYLLMFPRFVDVVYGEHGELLCSILRTADINKLPLSGVPVVDEVLSLISKLDSKEHNGVINFLGDNMVVSELKGNTLSYLFREILLNLRPSNEENTHAVAVAAMNDIQRYFRTSLAASYSKIWFEGETVLSIYSDLPSLRKGLVEKAKTVLRNTTQKLEYATFREGYVALVKRLTFMQDKNRTAVYEKYIAAQVIHSQQGRSLFTQQEQVSMIVSQSSDGKACTNIDKPLNKTAAQKHNTAPKPTVEPSNLLAEIYELDEATSKSKVRSKLEVLALPQLRQDFGYSVTALRKYPIMSKVGLEEPCWQYSYHGLSTGGTQGQSGLIMERSLPMYHCVNDILESELISKQEAMSKAWTSVCTQKNYKRNCFFEVDFADKEYLSSVNADASCRAVSISKVRPYIKYVISGSFNTNNWLFEAWRLQTLKSGADESDHKKILAEYNNAIASMAGGITPQVSALPLSTEGIKQLSRYKKIVNEVYRLDADLKSEGYSFSKLWYTYLADDFTHSKSKSRPIINATEYIDNMFALPTGYHAMQTRYSANAFAQTRDWVTCTTTNFSDIMNKLLSETEGKHETIFATLRQQVSEVKQIIMTAHNSCELGITQEQATQIDVDNVYKVFNRDFNMQNLCMLLVDKSKIDVHNLAHIVDFGLETVILQGLCFLEYLGIGLWQNDVPKIDNFIVNKEYKFLGTEIKSYAKSLERILTQTLSSDYPTLAEARANSEPNDKLLNNLRFIFLLLGLLYTMTIDEYKTYRSKLGALGIACESSGDPLADYEAWIARDIERLCNLCIAVVAITIGRQSFSDSRDKFIVAAGELTIALTVLGPDVETVAQKIKTRFSDVFSIHNALSSDLSKCTGYFNLLNAVCSASNLNVKPNLLAVWIALDDFGEFSKTGLKRLDISGCDTQTATEDDLSQLLAGDLFDEPDSTENSKPCFEYSAIPYVKSFIEKRKALAQTFSSKDADSLADCPYFAYMIGKLIALMTKLAEMQPNVHRVLQSELYLETDYRPYAIVDNESFDICTNIYNNLVYLMDTDRDGISSMLTIPGSATELGSNYTVYNIAQCGSSSYNRNLFDFVYCTTTDDKNPAGLLFVYHKPTPSQSTLPYYRHISGLYICGAQFTPEDMSDVALYCSEDDLKNTD